MRPRRAAAALAAALALGAAACRPPAPPAPARVRIATTVSPQSGLVSLALERGLPARHGVEAEVTRHAFGRAALQALLQGQADVATVAETPVVLAALRGEPLVVLATVATSARDTAVVARRDAGIAAPRDLAGKRVGLPRGTTADFCLDTLLVRHAVDRRTVRVVDLAPDAMAPALDRGEVDAVAAWQPEVARLAARLGDRGVTFGTEDLYEGTFNMVARPDWVKQHRPAAERLLSALLDAEALAAGDPEAAWRAAAAQSGGDPWPRQARIFDFRVRLEQGLLVLLAEEARWARREGLAPGEAPFEARDAVMPEPLRSVRPSAVTLLR